MSRSSSLPVGACDAYGEWHACFEGNRLGRPIFAISELEQMGYKMANDAISAITVMFRSVKELFVRLKETGRTGLDQEISKAVRKDIENTMGLDEYYQIEEQTVEKR